MDRLLHLVPVHVWCAGEHKVVRVGKQSSFDDLVLGVRLEQQGKEAGQTGELRARRREGKEVGRVEKGKGTTKEKGCGETERCDGTGTGAGCREIGSR